MATQHARLPRPFPTPCSAPVSAHSHTRWAVQAAAFGLGLFVLPAAHHDKRRCGSEKRQRRDVQWQQSEKEKTQKGNWLECGRLPAETCVSVEGRRRQGRACPRFLGFSVCADPAGWTMSVSTSVSGVSEAEAVAGCIWPPLAQRESFYL